MSPQKAEVKALRKGELKFYHRGNLIASVWKDMKLVCFLSTQSNPVGHQTVNRKQRDLKKKEWEVLTSMTNRETTMLWAQVAQVVALFAVVSDWCKHCKCSHHTIIVPELSCSFVSSWRRPCVSEGRVTSGHWPVESTNNNNNTKGRCKHCLK